MLADMGQKLDGTDGDDTRHAPDINGESAAYMMMNRNNAAAINLKSQMENEYVEYTRNGRSVIENYRADTMTD